MNFRLLKEIYSFFRSRIKSAKTSLWCYHGIFKENIRDLDFNELKLNKGSLLLCSLPTRRSDTEADIVISLTVEKPFNEVLHMPINDMQAPSPEFDLNWQVHKAHIHTLLDQGKTIAIHCHAGLGRTGTIAAKILIERGFTVDEAIIKVRQARFGSIETLEQVEYLKKLVI